MYLKSRHEDLIKIIGHIKNDKVNIVNYKDLDSYYEMMYRYLPSKSIVDFIYKLISIPVSDYVDDIDYNIPLLNADGSLNSVWDEWYIKITSQGKLDDIRFNKFRVKCFELYQSNPVAADELYRITRTYIIENPIVYDMEELRYIFINSKNKIPLSYRQIAIDYIRDSYNVIKIPVFYKICDVCGYVKSIDDKIIVHRLCNPTYKGKLLSQGTLVLKPEVFHSITNPGRFEYMVYRSLLEEGYITTIFPEIEKNGDILVSVNGNNIYLDMKAYNYTEELYHELVNDNGYLKDKYRNRWIIVPDLYYSEQLEYIGDILRVNGSRLYNIDDLLKKLSRI